MNRKNSEQWANVSDSHLFVRFTASRMFVMEAVKLLFCGRFCGGRKSVDAMDGLYHPKQRGNM